MSKFWAILLAVGCSAPCLAAQDAPAPAAAPAPEAIDPIRLAAAERMVALMLPEGIMQRMMAGVVPGMDSMMSLRAADIGVPADPDMPEADRNLTLAELMEQRDPHFRERMRISTQVTMQMMGEMMTALEPDMRRAMAGFFARRFTLSEIGEMTAFFATPTGRKYAEVALTMMQDPAFTEMMTATMQRMTQMMPAMTARIAEATAHLPPVPESPQEDE